jgi:hypothetical protein
MPKRYFLGDKKTYREYNRGYKDGATGKGFNPAGTNRICGYSTGYFDGEAEKLANEKKTKSLVLFRKQSLAVVPLAFSVRVAIDSAIDRINRAINNLITSLDNLSQAQIKLRNCIIDFSSAKRKNHGTEKIIAD